MKLMYNPMYMVHNILEKAADILEKADIDAEADIVARTTSPRHPGSHGS